LLQLFPPIQVMETMLFELLWAGVILLWLAIAATVATFRPVSRTAMWLLVPYLAWVSFAAVLNFTLWRMNS
jgi:tryptophan-rich sensory protein